MLLFPSTMWWIKNMHILRILVKNLHNKTMTMILLHWPPLSCSPLKCVGHATTAKCPACVLGQHVTLLYIRAQYWPLSDEAYKTDISIYFTAAANYTPCHLYTVGHKNVPTFWTITPTFLDGNLHFMHQWKKKWMLYKRVTKLTTLP